MSRCCTKSSFFLSIFFFLYFFFSSFFVTLFYMFFFFRCIFLLRLRSRAPANPFTRISSNFPPTHVDAATWGVELTVSDMLPSLRWRLGESRRFMGSLGCVLLTSASWMPRTSRRSRIFRTTRRSTRKRSRYVGPPETCADPSTVSPLQSVWTPCTSLWPVLYHAWGWGFDLCYHCGRKY